MITHTYNEHGKYLFACETPDGFRSPEVGPMEFVGIADHSSQYHDISTNMPVDMPPKPSEFHEFDFASKTWFVGESSLMLIRGKRDRLLKETDWMVTKALETGEPMPTGWATYRQALRDVTKQTDPLNIVWPIAPA